MIEDEGKPLIANRADGLGVRCGNGPHDDIPVTGSGEVAPGSGGMSVAPNWRCLPSHRIPRRLRTKHSSATGNDRFACWTMGLGHFVSSSLRPELDMRVESKNHGLVEPHSKTQLETYVSNLIATRDEWIVDEN